MGRSPCCSKEGLNRGAWTAMEDQILASYIKAHGEGKWRNLPKRAGLKRCGKSCRLRWLNYLRPDIKRGNISRDEEELIIRLHNLLGNRWSLIAGRLPGRTDNEIKNYWNTTLGKKAKSSSARSPTSPLSPIGKTTTSPASPGPSQPPSSAPAAKATRPQVVRARATWYSMYDLMASNPNRSSSDNQNYRLDPSSQIGPISQQAWDSEIARIHLGTDQDVEENCCPDFDFSNFGCSDHRFQPSNDGEGEKGIYYGNYYGTMEGAALDNWWSQGSAGGSGGGVGTGVDEIKGTLDIESLMFTFDSEQWTCP